MVSYLVYFLTLFLKAISNLDSSHSLPIQSGDSYAIQSQYVKKISFSDRSCSSTSSSFVPSVWVFT